jgi:hypothetical protein
LIYSLTGIHKYKTAISVEVTSTIIPSPQERWGGEWDGSSYSSHSYGRDGKFACRSNWRSNSEVFE